MIMSTHFAVRRTEDRVQTYEQLLRKYEALPKQISAKSFDVMMTILLTEMKNG